MLDMLRCTCSGVETFSIFIRPSKKGARNNIQSNYTPCAKEDAINYFKTVTFSFYQGEVKLLQNTSV